VLALTATDGLNFGENKSTAVAGCVNTFHPLKGKISLAKKLVLLGVEKLVSFKNRESNF
jgi:hypothetical protein